MGEIKKINKNEKAIHHSRLNKLNKILKIPMPHHQAFTPANTPQTRPTKVKNRLRQISTRKARRAAVEQAFAEGDKLTVPI
jgi:hypothetical protein